MTTTFYLYLKSNEKRIFKWDTWPVDWLSALNINLRSQLLMYGDWDGAFSIGTADLRRFRTTLIDAHFVPFGLLELLSNAYVDAVSQQIGPPPVATPEGAAAFQAAATADAERADLLHLLNEAIEKQEPVIVSTCRPGADEAEAYDPETVSEEG